MLKQYIINGKGYQFEEGEQPAGAVELKKAEKVPAKAEEPDNKAAAPANKARRVKSK